MVTLADVLASNTREGDLWERLDERRIRCYACGHGVPIPDGALGVCKVRFNRGGQLYVPWGYVGGVQCDPIEKKPFFHAYPGALAYSFGMLGCDLHCSYCQNWVTSQALRDPVAVSSPSGVSPESVVRDAVCRDARVLVSTYNEPLITSEWAVAIFKEARAAGLVTGFVSNGNATRNDRDGGYSGRSATALRRALERLTWASPVRNAPERRQRVCQAGAVFEHAADDRGRGDLFADQLSRFRTNGTQSMIPGLNRLFSTPFALVCFLPPRRGFGGGDGVLVGDRVGVESGQAFD